MAGQAQVANAPGLLLFQQIGDDTQRFIGEHRNGVLTDIVEEIEVKVVRAAFGQLALEDLRRGLAFGFQGGGGHFVRQKIAVPGVTAQSVAQEGFGLTLMIEIGRVKIIDPLVVDIVDQFFGLGRIDGPPGGGGGQAHVTHAQPGQGQTLKIFILHQNTSSRQVLDHSIPPGHWGASSIL